MLFQGVRPERARFQFNLGIPVKSHEVTPLFSDQANSSSPKSTITESTVSVPTNLYIYIQLPSLEITTTSQGIQRH